MEHTQDLGASPERRSLNRMILNTMQALLDQATREYVTAREVKDAIAQNYGVVYPIQTIIVVLNRFCVKGTVHRITFAGEEVRQRYGYYLHHSSEEFLEEKILLRFTSLANEFFQGNIEEALEAVQKLLAKKPAKVPSA